MSNNVSNKDLIQMSFDCNCKMHEDIKTFKAWNKEGRKIIKGQKATSLHAYIELKNEEKIQDGEENKNSKMICKPFKAKVFCRCQTEEQKQKEEIKEEV